MNVAAAVVVQNRGTRKTRVDEPVVMAPCCRKIRKSSGVARLFERSCPSAYPATAVAATDIVMKSRAHAGLKKVAAFCTLLGCKLLPFDGAANPLGSVGS